MHGSKKWIYDYKGRLKKSKDRTRKDFFSDLNNKDKKHWWGRECDDCTALNEAYQMSYNKFDCVTCREKQDIRYLKYHWSSACPAWFRRDLNRKYRTKCKQIIRDAKYNEELYETFSKPQHDAAWLWW